MEANTVQNIIMHLLNLGVATYTRFVPSYLKKVRMLVRLISGSAQKKTEAEKIET
jgi:hypothetical protein